MRFGLPALGLLRHHGYKVSCSAPKRNLFPCVVSLTLTSIRSQEQELAADSKDNILVERVLFRKINLLDQARS